jgi:transposase
VDALCRLIAAVDFELDAVAGPLRARLAGHDGYRAIQTIPGVGPVLAAVFVAELGEVGRFASAAHVASWAGLTGLAAWGCRREPDRFRLGWWVPPGGGR